MLVFDDNDNDIKTVENDDAGNNADSNYTTNEPIFSDEEIEGSAGGEIFTDEPYERGSNADYDDTEEDEDDDFSDLGIDEHEEYIIRMSKNERIQHLILFVCVTMLVITGFSVKFNKSVIVAMGSFGEFYYGIRPYLHRTFGTILICNSVYHFLHMAITKDGRLYFMRMFPRIKDVTDGIHNLSYMIGFSKTPPKCEWFDYKEKIEYWALQAGNCLIGGSGLLLWSNRYWSSMVVNVSYLIHGMEAVLATGAIIIWHFYYIHFKPGQFPMNRTWIDGKMSLAHLKHEHRMVYDRYMRQRRKEMKEAQANGEVAE